jgi:pseudaminic acid cytidylyltransferase
MLMACAPLIEASDLIKSTELFDRLGGKRMILSVAPFPVPTEWAFSRKEDGELVPQHSGKFAIRSQDLETHYYDSGSFAMYSADHILSDIPPSDEGYMGYILPKWKAIDIDDPEDWIMAETFFKGGMRTL